MRRTDDLNAEEEEEEEGFDDTAEALAESLAEVLAEEALLASPPTTVPCCCRPRTAWGFETGKETSASLLRLPLKLGFGDDTVAIAVEVVGGGGINESVLWGRRTVATSSTRARKYRRFEQNRRHCPSARLTRPGRSRDA